MTYNLKSLNNYTLQLEAELTKKELHGYVNEAEQALAHETTVDGFRKGKIPPEVLRKNLGEQRIKEEALQRAVSGTLKQVISEKSLNVIEQNSFVIKKNSNDEFSFVVSLTVIPEVKLGEYKGLTYETKPISVKEEEIGSVLKDVQAMKTKLEEKQSAAEIGDQVEVSFEIRHDGKIIDGGKSENHPVVLGDKKFVPGFEDNLSGMKPGEIKEFNINIPADNTNSAIAGKELACKAEVKKVFSRLVPELTDEFAKTLGKFATVEDLRKSVKEGLIKEKNNKEKDKVLIQLLDQIIAKSEIDVPPKLIDQQLDALIQGFDDDLHSKGMELSLYLAHMNKNQDDLRKEWQPQAEKQVRIALIVQQIAKLEKIDVSDSELDKAVKMELDGMAMRAGGDTSAMNQLNIESLKGRIFDSLLRNKVFEFVREQSAVKSA